MNESVASVYTTQILTAEDLPAVAELEQVTCNGQLSLACPECSVVLVSEQQADHETHSLDEHCVDAPMAHA